MEEQNSEQNVKKEEKKVREGQQNISDNNVDKSDNSSLLFKDSAYGSLGHSASSSMGPVLPPTGMFNQFGPHKAGTPSATPSSHSGGSSLIHSQTSSLTSHHQSSHSSNTPAPTPTCRVKVSASSRKKIKSNIEKIKAADEDQPSFLSSKDSKAAKVATLSQALDHFDQFRRSQAAKNEKLDKQDDIKTLVTNLTEVCGPNLNSPQQREELNQSLCREQQVTDNILEGGVILESDGFCVAVSMNNGMVVHTTPSLSSVLGYPKDMWIGRSIIDFVHPKDREYFINQVTENINLPLDKSKSTTIKNKSRNFFCRIRMYSGLKSGFAVKERKKKYGFFKMCVCFSEVNNMGPNEIKADLGEVGFYLFITAIPLASSYETPNQEGPVKSKTNPTGVFSTKHSAACIFTFLDESSVSLLGHFPHELEGTEIFDIIHPQDLNIVKESFENLIYSKNCKSHHYRMKTRNGDYVTVVTNWSCFVNPWNQQLEFIYGKHTVLKGPLNPNVFSESTYNQNEKMSEDKIKVLSIVQDDIKLILQTSVRKNQISKLISGSSSESKKKLSSFMGTLLQEVAKAESFELSRSAIHGAVVIGNISPHQSDSSESPPSYNQLTYNENLTRFFNSQPKTLSEKDMLSGFMPYSSPDSYEDNPKDFGQVRAKSKKEPRKSKSGGSGDQKDDGQGSGGGRSGQGSGEQGSGDGRSGQGSGNQQSGTGQTVSGSGEDNAKNSSSLQIGLSAGHIQQGAEECIMSQDGCTSGSGSRLGSGSREDVDNYKPPVLTEDLLVLHNREMEKQMVSKFKEAKRIGELGFLKDSKNKVDPSGSKRVLVSKIKGKMEVASGTTKRQQLSTIPEVPTKSVSQSNQQESGPAQEYQRPLAFTDSHFSSYSGTSTPNIIPNPQSRQAPGEQMSYPVPVLVPEDGSQKFIQVPAIMIPITCANTSSTQVFPTNMPLGLMMPGQAGTPTGFIPLCMGDMQSMYRGIYQRTGPGETEGPGPSRTINPSISRKAAGTSQFELPNCLAVNSCMTHRQENVKEPEGSKKPTKREGVRPNSGDGSRHTSIKGEPGSALESNASAGASVKGRNHQIAETKRQTTKQIGEELCSSSQSLYSFLPSSDDNDITDFLQASSSKPDDSESEDRVRSTHKVARPILSEPFWNENVTMSESLMKTYQMEQEPIETVLKRDMEKLGKMRQPESVDDQLKELKGFIDAVDEFDVMNLFAENEEDEDEETETTSPDEGEKDESFRKKKKSTRLKNLEKLNMFMEENAPFPESQSPPKQVRYESEPKKVEVTDKLLESDDKIAKAGPSTIEEVFKMTVARAGSSKTSSSASTEQIPFVRSKPQEKKFQYGLGMETNTVTHSQTPKSSDDSDKDKDDKEKKKGKASDDHRIKDSTDETESSEEILKTSSSVKSSSDDQKRKKGTSSPESEMSAKREDKKFKFGTDSDSSLDKKKTDSDEASDMKGK